MTKRKTAIKRPCARCGRKMTVNRNGGMHGHRCPHQLWCGLCGICFRLRVSQESEPATVDVPVPDVLLTDALGQVWTLIVTGDPERPFAVVRVSQDSASPAP